MVGGVVVHTYSLGFLAQDLVWISATGVAVFGSLGVAFGWWGRTS